MDDSPRQEHSPARLEIGSRPNAELNRRTWIPTRGVGPLGAEALLPEGFATPRNDRADSMSVLRGRRMLGDPDAQGAGTPILRGGGTDAEDR